MERLTNQIIPIGKSKEEDQDIRKFLKEVNVKSLLREINHIRDKSKHNGLQVSFQPPLLHEREIERRFNDDTFAYSSKCFYPWYSVRVNPYGDIYPCSMGITMGNIRQNKLHEIWNGYKYIRFRKLLRKNRLFPKCAKCCVLDNKLWSYLPKI